MTVHVNVSTTFGGAPSFTVIETAYGLPVAAPAAMVPLMSPVAVSIDSPGGSPVAPYIRVSLSASEAAADSETAFPSTLVRFARSWLNVGGVLTTVTGAALTGPVLFDPSETVTRTSIVSPLSPLPATDSARDGPVASGMSFPLRLH